MRTYSRGNGAAKKSGKHFFKRYKAAVITSGVLVLVAVALTLSLIFGLKGPVVDNSGPVDVPPVEQPIKFVAPLESLNVQKDAALDKLVWNETLKHFATHEGIDLAANAGENVLCMADGTVKSVENTILEGTVVTVTHKDGYISIYKGLDKAAVEAGEAITAGKALGTVGTMSCETLSGAHLHLEMLKDGQKVSAADYLDLGEK